MLPLFPALQSAARIVLPRSQKLVCLPQTILSYEEVIPSAGLLHVLRLAVTADFYDSALSEAKSGRKLLCQDSIVLGLVREVFANLSEMKRRYFTPSGGYNIHQNTAT